MPKRNFSLYLTDIVIHINKIEKYVDNITYDCFLSSDLLIDAISRNIEIVGEASSHIPDNIRKKYDYIPWQTMISMRNIVIHEYFGVDYTIIWDTAIVDLPPVKKQIEEILIKEDPINPNNPINPSSDFYFHK